MLIKSQVTVNFAAGLTLTESETRALDALVGYGYEQFKDKFYESLGKHYMRDHETGLKSLFETITREVPGMLAKIDEARKVLEKIK